MDPVFRENRWLAWLAGYLVVLFYIGWGYWLGILVGDWFGILVGDHEPGILPWTPYSATGPRTLLAGLGGPWTPYLAGEPVNSVWPGLAWLAGYLVVLFYISWGYRCI